MAGWRVARPARARRILLVLQRLDQVHARRTLPDELSKATGRRLPLLASFIELMFIVLVEDPDVTPPPIFLGDRLEHHHLIEELRALADADVHHIAFNLRHSMGSAGEVMQKLAEFVLPLFPSFPSPTGHRSME